MRKEFGNVATKLEFAEYGSFVAVLSITTLKKTVDVYRTCATISPIEPLLAQGELQWRE
jgi:hypothetical protein